MPESHDAPDKTIKLPQPMELIEKAWDWRWATKLFLVIIFIDIALLLSGETGILELSFSMTDLSRNFGRVCVAVCAFGLFCSYAVPASSHVLRWILLSFLAEIRWPSFFYSEEKTIRRSDGYVLMHQLRDEILTTQSDFLQKIYEQHENAEKQTELHREQVSKLIFGALILSLLDNYLPIFTGTHSSLVATVLAAWGLWGQLFCSIALLASYFVLKDAWFPSWKPQYIYYPPLFKKIRAKEIAEKNEYNAFVGSSTRDD